MPIPMPSPSANARAGSRAHQYTCGGRYVYETKMAEMGLTDEQKRAWEELVKDYASRDSGAKRTSDQE